MRGASVKRYYRVAPAIWNESWEDDVRLVAFYLLTCPHRTTEGLFRLPLAYAWEDMGWPAKRFEKAFKQLIANDFVEYDYDARVCLIVNALVYQQPENPNQVTAAMKAIRELPATPLLDRLLVVAETHSQRLAKALCEHLGKPLPEPLTQVVAQGIGESPSTSPSTSKPPLPPKGGRKRDLDRWGEEMHSWAECEFPGREVKAVIGHAKFAMESGASTEDEIKAHVLSHVPVVEECAA
jgi:hypothetical protein